MLNNSDDLIYVDHILDAINYIESYIKDVDFDTFSLPDNHMMQDAVIRQIAIIGEASKNLSDDLKVKALNIPWRQIMSARDRLVHEYAGVNLEIIWRAAKEGLPPLKDFLKDLNKS